MNSSLKEIYYYAHSKQIYNTEREHREIKYINKKFGKIINPNTDIGEMGNIEPYLIAISNSKGVVCSEYKGHIGRGVYEEILYAIKNKLPVYVIKRFLKKYIIKKVMCVKIIDRYDWKIRYGKIII